MKKHIDKRLMPMMMKVMVNRTVDGFEGKMSPKPINDIDWNRNQKLWNGSQFSNKQKIMETSKK
uniref:Uncharacterized protein n=1 Tax=Romanomermis culicivorax TaxID=13658 RepID=A0A915IZP0_ROMCU